MTILPLPEPPEPFVNVAIKVIAAVLLGCLLICSVAICLFKLGVTL